MSRKGNKPPRPDREDSEPRKKAAEQSRGNQRKAEPLRDAARRATFASAALIVLAAIGTYHNSLLGPFIFDDLAIIANPTIHQFRPIWAPLFPPDDKGLATDRRPVANLSLAINYALDGTNVVGYHVFNLAAHILAGLTLFGVVRRSLRLPSVQLTSAATPLALITALIWIVHPLQTNAVTYIIQRTEVLAGLFYLATLYCVLRGAESDRSGPWYLAAVVACFLAMGSKESAFSAPVVVLLYDRLFLAESWREIRQRRGWLYAGLAAAWLVPALYVGHSLAVAAARPARHVVGSGEARWLDYALAQFESIALYLRLSFWPHPLIVDYGPGGVKTLRQVAPYAAFVLALAGGTLFALWRRPVLGFLGVWFFAILAPSSSIVPIHAECAAEKRMYLPLAAVVLLTVAAAYRLGRHSVLRRAAFLKSLGYALAGVAVIALMAVSVRRNEDYRSALTIWQDTIAQRPRNPRAHYALGFVLADRGQVDEAIAHYRQALEFDDNKYLEAHNNLGLALAGRGQVDEAIAHYRKALEIDPDFVPVRNNLGLVLAACGQADEAITHYRKALEIDPDFAETHNNLGNALLGRGQVDEAITHYRKALEINPEDALAHVNLGSVLAGRGEFDEAIAHFRKALEINSASAETQFSLGSALVKRRELDEAIAHYRKALELKPDYAEAHNNLGNALLGRGQVDEALTHYRKALELKTDYAEARYNLASALARRGEVNEAIAHYRKALEIQPDLAAAHVGLGDLMAGRREVDEAIAHYRKALEIQPDLVQAHYNLGSALAGRGRLDEALDHYRKALGLALARNDRAKAEFIQARIRLLQSGAPAAKGP